MIPIEQKETGKFPFQVTIKVQESKRTPSKAVIYFEGKPIHLDPDYRGLRINDDVTIEIQREDGDHYVARLVGAWRGEGDKREQVYSHRIYSHRIYSTKIMEREPTIQPEGEEQVSPPFLSQEAVDALLQGVEEQKPTEQETTAPKEVTQPEQSEPIAPEPAPGYAGEVRTAAEVGFERTLTIEDIRKKLNTETIDRILPKIEAQTGVSFEIPSEKFQQVKKYLDERFASLIAHKAEQFLQNYNQEELKGRGIVPNAKGVAAVEAVRQLGEDKIQAVINQDSELSKINEVILACKQFSGKELPLTARALIIRELNELQAMPGHEGDETLRGLRILMFQKWTGREPDIAELPLQTKIDELFTTQILPAKLAEAKSKLTDAEKAMLAPGGFTDEQCAIIKASGYQFSSKSTRVAGKGSWLQQKFLGGEKRQTIFATRQGIEFPLAQLVEGFDEIEASWESGLRQSAQEQLTVQAKTELGSAFVHDALGDYSDQIEKIYANMRYDLDVAFNAQLQKQKEWQKTQGEAREVFESQGDEGKDVENYMRKAGTLEGLTGKIEDDSQILYNELANNWGFDQLSPEQITSFVKDRGSDYAALMKTPRGRTFFMLKLARHYFKNILGLR